MSTISSTSAGRRGGGPSVHSPHSRNNRTGHSSACPYCPHSASCLAVFALRLPVSSPLHYRSTPPAAPGHTRHFLLLQSSRFPPQGAPCIREIPRRSLAALQSMHHFTLMSVFWPQNGGHRLQILLHRLPPQAQQQFPVGHLRPTAYSPSVSHVVFIGVPRPASVVRAGEQRSEPRAATRLHGSASSTFNQPGGRLDTPALTGSLRLLSTMPGPYSVPALPPHRPRRQHTPRARVTAPPPASPGRRLRRIRPPAARSPSSSQALGYESLMPPPVSHRHLHGLYRFWQLRLAPK
ncbi:hypothetical protein NDU88_006914 [Pleurodeles waltl]|uniref:Uncharacterized protein n=1 Tax=Pleurodeles waltl TaxID=8319 RepID=A0AAV7U1Y2_PLEWA|nr:hypothetical protein NDU88_006914 [Pleurodeles waltl]